MSLRPFFAIVAKDLKLHVSNRRALILTVCVPIAIASFFGSLFGGQSGKTKASGVAVEVADNDRNEISKEIITNLFKDSLLTVSQVEEPVARESIRMGKVAVAVIVPKNFGADATRNFFGPGSKPQLTILHDPSRSMEAGMVQGVVIQHVMEAVSANVFSGGSGRKLARDALARLDQRSDLSPEDTRVLRSLLTNVDDWLGRANTNANLNSNSSSGSGFAMPFKMSDEETAKTPETVSNGYNGYAHSFGGMSMQFILMAAIEWGLAILLERQRGLWRRLRCAPVSRDTLLAGRLASSGIIAFATLMICWAFSIIVFHVHIPRASWLGFLACNAALSLFAASLGLFIAALGRTPEATRGIAIFVILILVMLGGAWVPSFIFPAWLQKITVLIPTKWAMDGFDAMTWRGLRSSAALLPVCVLIGSAIVFAALARHCFQWEAD